MDNAHIMATAKRMHALTPSHPHSLALPIILDCKAAERDCSSRFSSRSGGGEGGDSNPGRLSNDDEQAWWWRCFPCFDFVAKNVAHDL
jgi:hypothetical protein